jgi:hypothetical protein
MTKDANGLKSSVDATSPNETTTLRSKLETFDDILPYVGDFGRYQRLLLLALLPYSVAYATLYFSQFFLTLVPQEHWCRTEELVPLNLTQEERYNCYKAIEISAKLALPRVSRRRAPPKVIDNR